jgi:hypothetical protein
MGRKGMNKVKIIQKGAPANPMMGMAGMMQGMPVNLTLTLTLT